jgi:hypothetical protein
MDENEAIDKIMSTALTMSEVIALWAGADDEEIAEFDLGDKAKNRLAIKAAHKVRDSVIKGNYDDFMFGITSLCYAGVFGDGRDKWKLLPMAAEMSWRMARDSFKEELAEAVERLISEVQS